MSEERVVRVEWTDAAYHEDYGDDLSPIRGIAVGWLVADEPDYITLALEWFEDDTYRRLLAIPRRMIDHISDLAEPGTIVWEVGDAEA